MKIYKSMSEMLEAEEDEVQLAVVHHMLNNLTEFVEDNFIEEFQKAGEEECEKLAEALNNFRYSQIEIVAMLMRVSTKILGELYAEETTEKEMLN